MIQIKELLEKAKQNGRKALLEHESKQVLEYMNIGIPKSKLAKTEDEAVSAASSFGYPVVMKLMSPDVLHKSDSGAVKIKIKSDSEVKEIYKDFMQRFSNVHISGILVEEMVDEGLELIIGTNIDDTFGPVILFGVGGVLVEAIKDVVFRMCPTTKEQALNAINEIKASVLLDGFRGLPQVNKDELANLIVRLSELAWDYREYISEMDINPIIANKDGLFPVDARIILK